MQNFNTPSRPPQMRPGSSGNPHPGYMPNAHPNPSAGGPPPFGMMSSSTPSGQKRKLEGEASGNPHIPSGPGSAGTSTSNVPGQPGPGPGPGPGPAPTSSTQAPTQAAPERKFRPPMPPPHLLASLVPESKMFKDLIDMEQRLDWTMLRKRAEANDALGRVVKVSTWSLTTFPLNSLL